MKRENSRTDKILTMWLIILTILTIAGFTLCIVSYPKNNNYKVYAENNDDDFYVFVEEIPEQEIVEASTPLGKTFVGEIIPDEPQYILDVTDDDIDLLARVIMSESSVCSLDEKILIGCTIINRVKSTTGEFANQNTISDVVYYGKAYSTADNGEPNEECYIAAKHVLTYENIIPSDVYWFCHGVDSPYGYHFVTVGTTHLSSVYNHNN